ncbi:MAG: TlpA disulfide reductase family protein [Burkholderiaceae bacterium]|jgi:thiol-disulfide isomerase/thioredoxin
MNRAFSLVLALAALCAGIYFGTRQLDAAKAADAPAATFFTQNFPDAAGQPHAFSEYKGKIVVVNFWAPWCVPCVEEIPEFSKVSAEYQKRNVVFVGIGIDSASNIAEFQKKVQASYPLVVAGATGSELVRQYGDTAGGLPFTLVLDSKGSVRASKLGRVTEDELRGWLKPLAGG